MSDSHTDPTQWQDEPAMGDPETDDPTLDEPTADELDDPELNAAEAEADDIDSGLDTEDDPEAAASPVVEPGADGPEGTGTEGADDALLDDADWDDELDSPDLPDEFSADSTTAAELGNRDGDEMVSEDDDEAEVAELAGDDLDIDALAEDNVED